MESSLEKCIEDSARYADYNLSLQAAASVIPPNVIAAGAYFSEVTAEGYPGSRFHSGTKVVDRIEDTCIELAKQAFGSCYANVQPLSCSIENLSVLTGLLNPGDKILSLDLASGGHLTHGAPPHLTGRIFDVSNYYLVGERLDFEHIRTRAKLTRPKLIIAGASSYPRALDYEQFRAIADEFDAILVTDISHIAGLIVAGLHASPLPHAHVATTSTYKQLFGPRGGLILSQAPLENGVKERKNISKKLQRGLFPGIQGTPDFGQIAMKSAALSNCLLPEFANIMGENITLAQTLANEFASHEMPMLTGGTDTHMVVLDLRSLGISGRSAEEILERCGILSNRNVVPGDRRPPSQSSGLRFGTNIAAYRGVTPTEIREIGNHISTILRRFARNQKIEASIDSVKNIVRAICESHPIRNTHRLN